MATVKKAGSTNELVLNRNYTLASTSGHVVRFEKDKPVHVPPMMYREALSIGALPADGTEPSLKEESEGEQAPVDPMAREEAIMAAILKIVDKNERVDFTAAGSPSAKAVSRETGFDVQTKELKPVWQKYHDDQANEGGE